jgi:glycosyltransferase involved in cell wall biosynthesis
MRVAILSHNLTSNAAMRAHRLGLAARHFAEVAMIGPVKHRGAWGALPAEDWIRPIQSKNLPKFYKTVVELILATEADVIIAVKPFLSSYGVALLAGECRRIPVVLDIDDLDVQLAPKTTLGLSELVNGLRDPSSTVYLRILTRATNAAAGITVASTRLQKRFGGTLVPHGCPVERMNPATIDRDAARRRFGFTGPVVLFPGTRRTHKGLKPLAKAVARIPGASLAVLCRPDDFSQPEWTEFPLIRIPVIPYETLPQLLAAADVVAIPQLDTEAGSHQMPMKVYDAMAMAKPIVASVVSDLPIVLQNCASLVAPGDVSTLAKAIRHLLLNPDEAKALGDQARERCLKNYSMQHVADALAMSAKKAVEAFSNMAG